jgi:hypothetical protein
VAAAQDALHRFDLLTEGVAPQVHGLAVEADLPDLVLEVAVAQA